MLGFWMFLVTGFTSIRWWLFCQVSMPWTILHKASRTFIKLVTKVYWVLGSGEKMINCPWCDPKSPLQADCGQNTWFKKNDLPPADRALFQGKLCDRWWRTSFDPLLEYRICNSRELLQIQFWVLANPVLWWKPIFLRPSFCVNLVKFWQFGCIWRNLKFKRQCVFHCQIHHHVAESIIDFYICHTYANLNILLLKFEKHQAPTRIPPWPHWPYWPRWHWPHPIHSQGSYSTACTTASATLMGVV